MATKKTNVKATKATTTSKEKSLEMTSEEMYQRYILHTYAPAMTIVRGKGSYVWDDKGDKYLDFAMGISVSNLGHCHPAIVKAICDQAQVLIHTSNLFKTLPQPQLAAEIARHSFDGRVFFANSGAEANEGLIKFARKWGASTNRYEIICMDSSFHGRTLATLAATGRKKYCVGFSPNVEGFVSVPYNNLEAIEAAITEKTVAVLLEPIQGEGGIVPADKKFMKGVRALCKKRNLLMLLDEVQTGMGRTGTWFAYQHYGIKPDGMSMAKALGNGLPLASFEVREDLDNVLTPGTHASTFGGSPLACAAGLAVFKTMEKDHILEKSNEMATYFRSELKKLCDQYEELEELRGLGLMVGIKTTLPLATVLATARKHKMLILSAGENVIRMLPALTVSKAEINAALKILGKVFQELCTPKKVKKSKK